MKKTISLLLALVLRLSLCACGGGNDNSGLKIVGTWKTDPSYNDYVLVVNGDHTGSLSVDGEAAALTWTYDEATATLTLTKEDGSKLPLTYVEGSDTLVSEGPTFMRAE